MDAFQLHSLRAQEGQILLRVARLSNILHEGLEVVARSKNQCFPAQLCLSKRAQDATEEAPAFCALYEIRLPLEQLPECMTLTFSLRDKGSETPITTLSRHLYFPITDELKQAYCVIHRYCITVQGASLVFTKNFSHWRKEASLLWEIAKTCTWSGFRALGLRIQLFIHKRLPHKPIWLLKDRVHHGNDNAEALFLYLTKHHPEINTYFVIDKKSPDGNRLAKVGRIIHAGSRKHRLFNLMADVCLSSQTESWFIKGALFNSFLRDWITLRPFVFLQHGITTCDLSSWLNKYNQKNVTIIASAKAEKESLLNKTYGYSNEEIWLTGLARFDRLYRDEQKQITIMPTWRQWLFSGPNLKTGIWEPLPSFEQSTYFKFYDALLNHPRLHQAAKQYGYRIVFFPHPMIRLSGLLKYFTCKKTTLLPAETPYRKVFAESNLIVTDYSSAIFDFAYLRKPILYTHFDVDQFTSGAHTYTPGFFDYQQDAFGDITTTLEEMVDALIQAIEQDCPLKPIYRQRMDAFFAFNDNGNCERTYVAVSNMLKQSGV